MNKKKSIVFLVLLFLVVSVSLFAGRGNQQSETTFQGRGNYTIEKRDVDDSSAQMPNGARSMRANQVQNAPNSEDCLYLETGERGFVNQEARNQRNNQQQLNQQENSNRRNHPQQKESARRNSPRQVNSEDIERVQSYRPSSARNTSTQSTQQRMGNQRNSSQTNNRVR